MSYVDQIEAYVAAYPATSLVHVPSLVGQVTLPAYPHVDVQVWDMDFCELEDAGGIEIARFKLVG